ncbi:MAG: efflux RND transporter periplasmic adaptor subunit [Alphaproteobacteria bacterium]|nr:efflux RND transporter periplasmic adaptor subunit [Alphaproteobacteria bacterium]
MTENNISPETISQGLGLNKSGKKPLVFGKKRALIAGALAIIAVGFLAFGRGNSGSPVKYKTEPVVQGDLVVKVSATGNLQPTTEVDVSSELSGIVDEVLVQDNDTVTKDQVLARLDTSRLKDQVIKSEAALKAAQATVQLNKAATKEARANYDRMQQAWKLSNGKIPSKSELTTAEAALDKAIANEENAKASVAQAEATLRSDQTNLSKAEIRSPIDGIVLLRSIEPGQTVAASLQAPVLFKLAQTLTQMELQVAIDEADVGQVREGQDAEFSVDAYPNRTYPARITRVRYGSETTNNVVTYQGVLQVANDDFSLRPGMTATASIVTLKRDKALLVPSAALRFTPDAQNEEDGSSGGVISKLIPHPPMNRKAKKVSIVAKGSDQDVWVLREGRPVAVPIKVGASDGHMTEVASGDVKVGDELITDAVKAKP